MKFSTIYTCRCQQFCLVKFAIHLSDSGIIPSSGTTKWRRFLNWISYQILYICFIFFCFHLFQFSWSLCVLRRCFFSHLSIVWVSLAIATENSIATIGLVSLPINSSGVTSSDVHKPSSLKNIRVEFVFEAHGSENRQKNETTWSIHIKGNVDKHGTINNIQGEIKRANGFRVRMFFVASYSFDLLSWAFSCRVCLILYLWTKQRTRKKPRKDKKPRTQETKRAWKRRLFEYVEASTLDYLTYSPYMDVRIVK